MRHPIRRTELVRVALGRGTRFLLLSLFAALLVTGLAQAPAQSPPEPQIDVADELRPIDNLLSEQFRNWLAKRDSAAEAFGRDSEQWFKVNDQENPLAIHGMRILDYAKAHPGSSAAFTCLGYVIDFGEGRPVPLYQSACTELVAQHKNNPALSWLVSRCTNALYLESMGDFLTRLQQDSPNATVRGAAAYYQARLYDNAVSTRDNLSGLRKQFKSSGILAACPEIQGSLDFLQAQSKQRLIARRDELVELVLAKYASERPWTAVPTFGRLDYRFRLESEQPTLGVLANGFKYEIEKLRVGCQPPDFNAVDIEGRPFRLTHVGGRPTLIMFSFKGCGACQATYPALRALRERYATHELAIVGVMADESADVVRGTVAAGDITWQCVWDGPSGPIAKSYCVTSYPTFLLVDKNGKIAATKSVRLDPIAAVEQIVGRKASN
jgi:thiol-disulfide isomerase/thioredoxin